MIVSIVLAVFLGIVLLDYIPHRKSRKKKENMFYGVVLAVCFIIVMLYSLEIALPNPTEAIESIVKMIVPVE